MAERKTQQAKQLLIRYIKDKNLKSGDKLPPQNQLREIFNYGATTICAAINELKNDGVLEVRDKVGVFLANPQAGGHAGRIIGITMTKGENNFYYSCLLSSLQMHLVENSCMVKLFRCVNQEKHDSILYEIDDFPGLRRSIENKELQGLIHLDDFSHIALEYIQSNKLPLIFVGSKGGIAQNGVFFDHKNIIKEACKILKEKQVQRPILICPQCIENEVKDIFYQNYPSNAKIFFCNDVEDDSKIVNKILLMEENNRPDWLICLDDISALHVINTLAKNIAPKKMPGAFIMYNLASRINYPIRQLVCCNNNLHQFAEIGVNLLMKTMMSEKANTGEVFYLPEIIDLSNCYSKGE
jgi:DNA-binding LacI/PurR family transcriptional regulator